MHFQERPHKEELNTQDLMETSPDYCITVPLYFIQTVNKIKGEGEQKSERSALDQTGGSFL